MYEIAVKAVDEAIAKFGEEANAALPNTAYCLPCLYAFSGEKFQTLGQVKNGALTFIKDFMTRNLRVHDVFTNGIATAL
ncbi:MAG: CO dehydrogenase/CO-methylating acetyl-CoA synthase complex subunit beta, partial [Eubacteriaceae bacterium]|nr:CO dehydrogenase/CO-methylating acetyl-CoA synthase complex subunit beta [Eubacteriaceae bacterium]